MRKSSVFLQRNKDSWALFACSVLFFTACLTFPALAEDKISVVCTTGQITDVVKIIGGERVQVQGLMGAGVDPHLYKASAGDVRKLAQADIIFYNGLFLEAKMEEIFKKMSRGTKTVPVGENIPKELLLESVNYSGHYDPHIWFDVTLWIRAAQSIRDTLAEFDPEHREEYSRRASAYLRELGRLHLKIRRLAKRIPADQRVLVTAHDAFRYFGRQYGFQVIGLQGISTESKPGTADVIRLADFIAKQKIRAIFVESSVPVRNIEAVRQAVRARGWDVKIGGELFSDAVGDEGTFEGTYIGMVTHNIETVVEALTGQKRSAESLEETEEIEGTEKTEKSEQAGTFNETQTEKDAHNEQNQEFE